MKDISLLDSVPLKIIIYRDSNYYKYIHSGMNFSFIQYVLIIAVALTRPNFESMIKESRRTGNEQDMVRSLKTNSQWMNRH